MKDCFFRLEGRRSEQESIGVPSTLRLQPCASSQFFQNQSQYTSHDSAPEQLSAITSLPTNAGLHRHYRGLIALISIAATAFSHAKRFIISSPYHFTWGVGVNGLFLRLGVIALGYSILASASFWVHLFLEAVERSSAFCMIPWVSDICSKWIRER